MPLKNSNADKSETMGNKIIEVANRQVQDYIFDHSNEDEKKLLLKHKTILGIPTAVVAQQIAARKKVEHKIPFFYGTKGIVYPRSLNLEQSSSEATAKFKAEFIRGEIKSQRPTMVDLTGGFGIDSFFFSNIASTVDYIEPNAELNDMVRHNFEVLKRGNVLFHQKTAEQFLTESSNPSDVVYLDPSRRDSRARKVFSLRDSSPDAVQLLSEILKRADFILLKTSPLLDIKMALKELSFVKKVLVVSVGNECKELLFLMEQHFSREPLIQSFNLDNDGKTKHALEFQLSEEEKLIAEFAPPQKYLYEPNASILKAGAFKFVGKKFGLKKIHVNTHLYTSEVLVKDFPGRIFEVEELAPAAKSLSGEYANIICRNHPLSPEDLKKKLKTKDGGEKYVLAFSGFDKKYIVTAKRLA